MTKCKKCKASIIWERNSNDKWIPLNLDGSLHFDTCLYAKEFRNKHFNQNNFHDYTKIRRENGQKGL